MYKGLAKSLYAIRMKFVDFSTEMLVSLIEKLLTDPT